MATQVQIRRGTSTECDAFTGVVGELFYDTTNKRVRASDGATAGGTAMAKRSESALLVGAQNLTGGFTGTAYDAGTKSSGTFTPDATLGNIQKYTNNGAHTLAPPSPTAPADSTTMILDQTNGASAGTVTRTGFTKVTGDSLDTTNGHKFRHYISVGPTGSHIHTQAMQ